MNPRRLAPELTIIHYKAGWLLRRPGRGQICMSPRLPSPTVPPVNPGFYHSGAGSDPRQAGPFPSQQMREELQLEVTSACLALERIKSSAEDTKCSEVLLITKIFTKARMLAGNHPVGGLLRSYLRAPFKVEPQYTHGSPHSQACICFKRET